MSKIKYFDESTFYPRFIKDIDSASDRLIIESAFLTTRRTSSLLPYLNGAVSKNVEVIINTRNPNPRDGVMYEQANESIALLQEAGCVVLLTVNHHRKLAVIDGHILWEGSMNILSQADSCEIMRRSDSRDDVSQLLEFINLKQWYS